ncbi:hypothetical protein [Roseivirga pacifica]|uniref:hypothetical protein n=1 Tax=Roseivirga pacifica TaxID=1267423 RepID=UPI003BB04319
MKRAVLIFGVIISATMAGYLLGLYDLLNTAIVLFSTLIAGAFSEPIVNRLMKKYPGLFSKKRS